MKTKVKDKAVSRKFWVIKDSYEDDFLVSMYVNKNGHLDNLEECQLFKTKKEATKVAYPDREVVLKVEVYINRDGERAIKFIL